MRRQVKVSMRTREQAHDRIVEARWKLEVCLDVLWAEHKLDHVSKLDPLSVARNRAEQALRLCREVELYIGLIPTCRDDEK